MATLHLSGFFNFPLAETFLPMLVKEPAEYFKPDNDDASNKALLHEPESNKMVAYKVFCI
jgi:hypothetical protein